MTSDIIIPTSAPHWAAGCEKCRFGLVEAPHTLSNYNLWEQRMAQAKHGLLEFCDCKAGQSYRLHLLGQYKKTRTDELYTTLVIDTSTKQTIPNDDDGKPMTLFDMMEYRVVNDSVNTPRKRFWEGANGQAQLGQQNAKSGGVNPSQGASHPSPHGRAQPVP